MIKPSPFHISYIHCLLLIRVNMREINRKKSCSYRNNKRQKEFRFKKGNTHALNRWQTVSDSGADNSVECSFSHSQLQSDSADGSLKRLSASVAQDVLYACGQESKGPTLPFRLRPAADTVKLKQPKITTPKSTPTNNENAVVNLKMLESAFNTVAAKHSCGQPRLKLQVSERKGICLTVKVTCCNCNFVSSDMELFQSYKKRGISAGLTNSCLILPVLGSKMGISDIHLVLACLNIQAPDKRGMQRKLNNLTEDVEQLNKAQLAENQQYVRQVERIAGNEDGTHLEFDVSYASRPLAGGSTATQCYAPTVEKTTCKKLPVDIQVANKLCPVKDCDHKSKKCKQNYNSNTSINQAEPEFLKKTIQNIEDQEILRVSSVTTDGSRSLAKAMRILNSKRRRQIKHYKCFVHNMRNLHKKLRSAKIKQPTGKVKAEFTRILASRLRDRIRLELGRLRVLPKANTSFLSRAQAAINNIMDCFHGNHSNCRKASVVCTAHLKSYKKTYLPYSQQPH